MPTRTFENLQIEKQTRIVDAAIAEFATHVFADANLDRIALGADVSKGSLFQYFEDKSEFYIYAVQVALDRAWQFYEQHIERTSPGDCYQLLAEAILSMLALKEKHPHLAKLYLRVVYAKESHSRETLFEYYIRRNEGFFDHVIQWGIEDGRIDPELPDAIVRFQLHAVGSHLTYLILSGDDPRWLPQGPRRLRQFIRQTVEAQARAFSPQPSGANN